LEAKALFEHLAQSQPGGVKAGLLRTFQRRVKLWRVAEVPGKEVFFTQDHKPGEGLAVDWTVMDKEENRTANGRRFTHIIKELCRLLISPTGLVADFAPASSNQRSSAFISVHQRFISLSRDLKSGEFCGLGFAGVKAEAGLELGKF